MLNDLFLAIRNNKQVKITYCRSKDNKEKNYLLEPKHIRSQVLWAFDKEDNQIKQFRIERIKKVTILGLNQKSHPNI